MVTASDLDAHVRRHDDVEPDHDVLSAVIAAELAVDDLELDAESLAGRCLRLRRERDRLDVAIARADSAFERSRAFRRLPGGCTKASQWLAANGEMSVSAARAAVRHARRLCQLPVLMDAVVSGAMSGWQARQVTAAGSTPDRLTTLGDQQDRFLDHAQRLDPGEFGAAIEHWTETNYGDEIAERAVRQDRNRRAHCSRTFGGMWRLDANLHPVWGTVFSTGLSRIESELFEVDWARARRDHGEATTVGHLWRTPAQRRHDALVVMAMRAEVSQPNAAGRRPLVSVLVDWPTLHGRVCELDDGTHLAADQVLDVLRTADVERAVWGSDDRVRVSHRARVFRGAERRAVELRDRFCTAVGCDAPPEDCDVDHKIRYEHDGLTRQVNGQMRCPEHHEGRRSDPDRRPLPNEYHLDDYTDLDLGVDDPGNGGDALTADMRHWLRRPVTGVAPDTTTP